MVNVRWLFFFLTININRSENISHIVHNVFGLGDANEAEPCVLALVAPNQCYAYVAVNLG
jgi:hypothetical protein